MPKVLILRGIPGSGKSTLTKEFLADPARKVRIVSADHFFMETGEYKFDATKIGQAHQSCFRNFLYHVQNDPADLVIVDNTCVTVAEIAPYVLAAESFGFDVKIITLRADPKVAASRNIHGVPPHAIERMATLLDEETKRLMPWWNHEVRS